MFSSSRHKNEPNAWFEDFPVYTVSAQERRLGEDLYLGEGNRSRATTTITDGLLGVKMTIVSVSLWWLVCFPAPFLSSC